MSLLACANYKEQTNREREAPKALIWVWQLGLILAEPASKQGLSTLWAIFWKNPLSGWKKAIIKLAEGQSIEFFEGV